MQYAILNANGAIEVRRDSCDELPAMAVEVTDEQMYALLGDTPSLLLRNGELVEP